MSNVVLITIDCLRADHIGCYGYHRPTTPFIDRLASEGTRFENAFANGPFTASSFISILASAYPLDFGYHLPFPREASSISEGVSANGVRTAAIHSNPYLSEYYGYNRGWDYFQDFVDSDKVGRNSYSRFSITDYIPEKLSDCLYFLRLLISKKLPYEDAGKITRHATDWLDDNSSSPFFIWIHYMDLHEPYIIPNDEMELQYSGNLSNLSKTRAIYDTAKKRLTNRDIRNMMDIYDDKLRYVDENLKSLFGYMKSQGLCDDTLAVITADHGQEFLDHGHFGHAARFYDEIIHIPLIISGGMNSATRGDLVSQVDISPTILDFLSIQIPSAYRGQSMFNHCQRDFILCEAAHDEDGVYISDKERSEISHRTFAIRSEKYKFISKRHIDGEITNELYDLVEDPGEKMDLSDQCASITGEFSRIVGKHIAKRRRAKNMKQTIKKIRSERF